EIIANELAQGDLLQRYAQWRDDIEQLTGRQLPNLIDLMLGSETAMVDFRRATEAARAELADQFAPALGHELILALDSFISAVMREIDVQEEAAELARLKAEEVRGGAGAAR